MPSSAPGNLFGQLRSLLQKHELVSWQRERLWSLLELIHERDPDRYHAEFVPYVCGFPHHFELPLITVNDLDDLEGLTLIAPLPCVRLALRESSLDVEALRTLLASPHVPVLHTLHFRLNGLGDEGAQLLADSTELHELTALRLWNNGIGDTGAEALADSRSLHDLKVLDLWGNRIGDSGAKALAESPHLSSLTRLDLSTNRVGKKGARALANSPFLSEEVKRQLRF